MPFPSVHAPKIWNDLYTVYIPDQITLEPEYIRRFGVYVTQNKEIDRMLETNMTMVKIPIIKILEYYLKGIEIQIPSREDMIKIHKHIELYLDEWREHIRTSIHGHIDAQNHKDLLTSLEKLSKHIYDKAKPREVVENLLTSQKLNIGLLNPLTKAEEENKEIKKPNYNSIRQLISPRSKGDSNGRFS